MPRPIIPIDPKGYMIVDSEVHTRYATHCQRGMRVRTVDEVFGSLARALYTVCETCYPPPASVEPPKSRARRPKAQDALVAVEVEDLAAELPDEVDPPPAVLDEGEAI